MEGFQISVRMETHRLCSKTRLQNLASFAVSVAAGGSFVLALPPYSILPLALIPFAVLAVLLRGVSPLKAFSLGYVFGLGQFVPGLFWITESFQVEADRFGWLALPAVFGLAMLLSAFPALACAIATRMTRAGLPSALSLASAWVASEWLRGHILTGFPWNLAAYSLADWTVLSQAASLVGSYGLGFLIVLSATLAGYTFCPSDHRLRRLRVAGTAAILIGISGFGIVRIAASTLPPEGGTRIRVVQPNIAQSAKWDQATRDENKQRLITLSERAGSFDLLLWPETAWPGFLAEDEGARIILASLLPESGVLITGSPVQEETATRTTYRNAVLAIASDGTILAQYAKHHLVPFGEYVPLRGILPLPRLVESRGDFVPGPGPSTLAIGVGLPLVGVAICYEAIFPGHVVDGATRPSWIFNATNDAWFGTSIGPWQHLASARMRAVEEGLPLVRAANTGISVVVDAYGRTIAMIELERSGIIDARLPRPLPPTPYARFGDWTAIALIMFAWIIAGLRLRLQKPARLTSIMT